MTDNDLPRHWEWPFPYLGPTVYAVTLPTPFRPVILIRDRSRWDVSPDHRAHEYVHLRQIERMGGWRYLGAHVAARWRSVVRAFEREA